jgi:hypothetical protein
MSKYYVYSNLNHDHKEYHRGDRIELSDEQASTLFQLGVIGNDKPEVAEAPAPVTPQEAPAEPVAGGTTEDSGEPSIDAPSADSAPTETVDVTPKVSERMTREELEAIAANEGIASEAVQAASTKASLVDLIEANRAPADAAPAEDPSANL